MADAIGLGKITGIDLPNEKNGLIPSTAWKRKTFGEPWYEGETVSVSIGQGAVWLTPIQLAQLSAFVANEGVNFKPQIVNRIVSPEGKIQKTFEPVMNSNVKMKKEVFKIVKDGMRGVVNEPSGTAYGSRLQNVSMSGKTGTAQSVGEKGKNSGRPCLVYSIRTGRGAFHSHFRSCRIWGAWSQRFCSYSKGNYRDFF